MRQERVSHYDVFKKKIALRVILCVVFAMLVNIANFPAAIAGKYSVLQSKYNLQIDSTAENICNAVAVPVHVMNDLLKKANIPVFGGTEKDDSYSKVSGKPVAQHYKQNPDYTVELLRFDRFVASSVSAGKYIENNLSSFDIGHRLRTGGYALSDDSLRKILLFLMLMSALPRGISIEYNNNENIKTVNPGFCL